MTFYTAIGKYELKKDTDGNKFPVIIAEEKEHTLDPWEMIPGKSGAGAVCYGTS